MPTSRVRDEYGVVTDVTSNLQPGEDGTFTVHVTNASATTGVRLTNVTLTSSWTRRDA
jgi:hypothetical protein